MTATAVSRNTMTLVVSFIRGRKTPWETKHPMEASADLTLSKPRKWAQLVERLSAMKLTLKYTHSTYFIALVKTVMVVWPIPAMPLAVTSM